MKAIAYVRVSTAEQAGHGGGLDAQREAIRQGLEARTWTLAAEHADTVSGGMGWPLRPGLAAAIADLESGMADVLIVAKLDRLTRSVADFASILERAKRKRWSLVALDLAIDTSTPSGELLGNVLAAFSQFERALIGARTREGMAALRSAGKHMGRRSTLPANVRQRIVREHQAGLSLSAIARGLNGDGIPTGRGAPTWQHSAVRAALTSVARSP